jgi:hypothetical protein
VIYAAYPRDLIRYHLPSCFPKLWIQRPTPKVIYLPHQGIPLKVLIAAYPPRVILAILQRSCLHITYPSFLICPSALRNHGCRSPPSTTLTSQRDNSKIFDRSALAAPPQPHASVIRFALMSPRLSAPRDHGSKSPLSPATLPHQETHLPKCRFQRILRKARPALVRVHPPTSHQPGHREPAILRGQSRNHEPYYYNGQAQQQCRKQALDLFPDLKLPSIYAVVWDVVGASMLWARGLC